MTSGQAHVPSEWSREAMTSAPYQVTSYEAAPASYPAIPSVAPAPVQYAPQPQYQMATYGDRAPLAPYPNQNQLPAPNVLTQPEQKGNKTLKYIAIGAASLVAVGAVSTALMLKGINDTIKSTPNDGVDRNTSAPAIPGETQPNQNIIISPETELHIEAFDSQRQKVLAEIMRLFEEDGFKQQDYRMYEGRSIETGSPGMSPTAILDRNSAKNTYLTSDLQQKDALKQVDIAARPGTEAFNNLTDRINHVHNGTAKISADEDLLIQSKYFDNGTFYDKSGTEVIDANNTPTQIISAMSQRERTNTIYTFQWDKTADANKGDWRLITAAEKPGDTGYVDPLEVNQVVIK